MRFPRSGKKCWRVRERVCECWKDSLCKMVGGVGEFVEVEASDAGTCQQWYVKEK
jgi:hypothetical protein